MNYISFTIEHRSAHEKTNNLHMFTAKLICVFVFATGIVQFLFYLNPKFQASSSFLCLYSPVCVGSFRKPHCWFSHDAAQLCKSQFERNSKVVCVPRVDFDQ